MYYEEMIQRSSCKVQTAGLQVVASLMYFALFLVLVVALLFLCPRAAVPASSQSKVVIPTPSALRKPNCTIIQVLLMECLVDKKSIC